MKKIMFFFLFLILSTLQAKDCSEHKVVLQVQEPDGSMLTRNGELLIRPDAKANIILVHAFKGDKSQTKALRVLFPQCNTLVFDFRAHGDKREGQCCSFGAQEVADLKAAADFLKNHPDISRLPLFAYGASMGAATIIEAQAQHDLFSGVIVDSPFESMENVIKRGLAKMTYVVGGTDLVGPLRRLLERNMFHPLVDRALRFIMLRNAGMDTQDVVTCLRPVKPIESIKSVSIPMLIIGCNQDTLTPPEGIKKLYDIAQRPNVQLWLVDGRGHVDAFFSHPEEYTKRVTDFIGTTVRALKRNPERGLLNGFISQ